MISPSRSRRSYFIMAILLLSSILMSTAHAQFKPVQQDTQSTQASGTVLTFQNNAGGVNASFEYLISGTAPATISIAAAGCMRGGTCTSALNTYTVVANAIKSFVGPFDSYQFTISWTGGDTTTKVTINSTTVLSGGAITSSGGSPGSSAFSPLCPNRVQLAAPGSGLTQIVALSAGKSIYVCQLVYVTGTAGATLQLESGTGANCGTGTTATPFGPYPANLLSLDEELGQNMAWQAPVSQALCVNMGQAAAAGSTVEVQFAQF